VIADAHSHAMDNQFTKADALGRSITDETLHAIGLPEHSPLRPLLRPVFWPIAGSFARFAAEFDDRVGRDGMAEAARWAALRYVASFDVRGTGTIPATGPLLVASNHPGVYDVLLVAASLPRPDLKIIVSDIPFARSLAYTAAHVIYTATDSYSRMAALRAMISHLRAGGAVLIFASGLVDPDPAFLPGAREALETWSASLELCVRQVPQTAVVPIIVSGVLAPQDWERRKLAEFVQVIQQILFRRQFGLRPRVSFGAPFYPGHAPRDEGSPHILASIIEAAQQLLTIHTQMMYDHGRPTAYPRRNSGNDQQRR
jgi:hypothetical protein